MKKKIYPAAALLFGFIGIMTAADLLTPVRTESELENRKLKVSADFSFERLWSGDFQKQYEEVVIDQFAGRDSWITVKSVAESALLKTENNGVLYGKNGALFGKLTDYDREQTARNLSFLNDFAEEHGGLDFGIIPSGYAFSPDQLPDGAGQLDQKEALEEIRGLLGDAVQWLDAYRILEQENQAEYSADGCKYDWFADHSQYEALYYNTDHHWRGTTAYKFYRELCARKGYARFAYGNDADLLSAGTLNLREIEGFYGTYYSKCKKVDTTPDTLTFFDLPFPVKTVVDGVEKEGWYDAAAFDTRDKYSAFLYGNGGLTVLSREEVPEDPARMLLIKDSYSNVLAPLFLSEFDEVYVVDLRSYPQGINALCDEKGFAEILVLYNFENFQSDKNFYRLTY